MPPELLVTTAENPEAVDDVALAREAIVRYGFPAHAELERYELTENWTFRVTDTVGPAPIVLRVYRPGVKSQDEIRSELAWMSALRDDEDLPVPEVMRTHEEDQLVTLRRGTQSIYCAAFGWVPGREPPETELSRWFPRLGELTARMHRHARCWTRPRWFSRMRWDAQTTLGPKGHWGPWSASVHDPEERCQLAQLEEVVTERLIRFGVSPDRFGLVHADLRLANVLVDGDQLTILDFDDCGDSWYLYDLAATLTFNEGRPDVDELIAAWADAYRSVEPLSVADEAEIMTFLMLRRLMLSAYVGLRDDTELARELAAAGFSGETCRLAERYLATHTISPRGGPTP
jgi:Ser/Thr protein kinase RdoA (MazF antagonist)